MQHAACARSFCVHAWHTDVARAGITLAAAGKVTVAGVGRDAFIKNGVYRRRFLPEIVAHDL